MFLLQHAITYIIQKGRENINIVPILFNQHIYLLVYISCKSWLEGWVHTYLVPCICVACVACSMLKTQFFVYSLYDVQCLYCFLASINTRAPPLHTVNLNLAHVVGVLTPLGMEKTYNKLKCWCVPNYRRKKDIYAIKKAGVGFLGSCTSHMIHIHIQYIFPFIDIRLEQK